MYLTKKTYVKNWEHNGAENQYTIDIKKGGNPVTFINPKRISYIEEEVMYWRKANQIHNWFVPNVQDGEDDCKEYYVTIESILDLYDTVVECLNGGVEVALDKLPPQVVSFSVRLKLMNGIGKTWKIPSGCFNHLLMLIMNQKNWVVKVIHIRSFSMSSIIRVHGDC